MNKKLFGLFNILDLFVIVAIIVVATGTVFKFNIPGMSNDGDTLSYTVSIAFVRDFTVDYYKEGLSCYDSKTGEFIGTIKAVRSEPLMDMFVCSDGSIKLSEVPETVKIELDIEAAGVKTEQGYFVKGVYELKVGSILPFCTKYTEVEATVRDIRN